MPTADPPPTLSIKQQEYIKFRYSDSPEALAWLAELPPPPPKRPKATPTGEVPPYWPPDDEERPVPEPRRKGKAKGKARPSRAVARPKPTAADRRDSRGRAGCDGGAGETLAIDAPSR